MTNVRDHKNNENKTKKQFYEFSIRLLSFNFKFRDEKRDIIYTDKTYSHSTIIAHTF